MFYIETKNKFGRPNAIGCGRVIRRRKGQTVKIWELIESGDTKISFAVTVDSIPDPDMPKKRKYLDINVSVYASRVSEQVMRMAEHLKGGETVFFGGIVWRNIAAISEDGYTYEEVQADVLAYPENLLSGLNGTEVTQTAGGKRRVRKTRKSDISPVEGYAF